jgi:hypothetical protein
MPLTSLINFRSFHHAHNPSSKILKLCTQSPRNQDMNFKKSHALPLLVGILFPALLPLSLQAQTDQPAIGCTQNKSTWICNRDAFAKALHSAKTITLDLPHTDHTSAPQLKDLAHSLGKTVQPAPADLIFVLVPATTSDGVFIGGSGVELGGLLIYASTPSGQRGPLLWGETFTGQPDMPWPSVVHELIQQLQAKFK